MNNATSEIHLAENLGSMQNAHFLRNHLGIGVSRTHFVAGGLHIELSTLAHQAGLKDVRSSGKNRFCGSFRIKVSSTMPTAASTTQYLRCGRARQ
ncbi:MAG: hypothetical protein ABSA83_21585 [Verrucomicrobiota bacterium]|jgi:hypothetical protein